MSPQASHENETTATATRGEVSCLLGAYTCREQTHLCRGAARDEMQPFPHFLAAASGPSIFFPDSLLFATKCTFTEYSIAWTARNDLLVEVRKIAVGDSFRVSSLRSAFSRPQTARKVWGACFLVARDSRQRHQSVTRERSERSETHDALAVSFRSLFALCHHLFQAHHPLTNARFKPISLVYD